MRNVKSLTLSVLTVIFLGLFTLASAHAADNKAGQQRAAEDYLRAVASGDASAMAQTILTDELVQLRTRLLNEMRLEADRGESLTRVRLFGDGMPLADLERMTPQAFFVTLSQRLRFGGREFRKVDWLESVNDKGGMVQMVGRLIPPDEFGDVRVPVVVSIVPWGKDWKAALPLELQAQIEDLRKGRVRAGARPATAVASAPAAGSTVSGAAPSAGTPSSATPKAIIELFDTALANLEAGKCETFFEKQMSPNFRRTTGSRALRTLISSCETRESLRTQVMTAIRLAREGTPEFQYGGTRAVFDLEGSGLPYRQWIVERIDDKWYIAE